MNIRLLASGLAIAVAGVLGYAVYQIIPMGAPLARSEVIGELNGPALASYSRVSMQRFGERQLLTGQLLVTPRDVEGLSRAPVLDTQVPALMERSQKQRERLTRTGAAAVLAHDHDDLAMRMLQTGSAATDTRNLIYGGRGTGAFELLGSISGDTGLTLIGTPQGKALYLVTGTVRSTGDGDQPDAWDTLRSDDLGATWTYDPEVTLGAPQQHTVFLAQDLAVALEPREAGMRLLHSCDGARRWSAALLKEQVWPDAAAFERGFAETAGKERGLYGEEQLAYGWSLYPLDEKRAVGWSWRTRVRPDAQEKDRVIETRRFEVEFQEGASPAFRITPAVPPVPAQKPHARVARDQPVFETTGDAIYELDKAGRAWIERSVSPEVRGMPTWIGDAWFGRNAWVIKTYADHMLSFGEYTKTYFYTRDQGKTWLPFQLSHEQERGLLGLDLTGDALLSLAERGGKTVIQRYPLD
ncbi:ATP synthase F0 subunit C [Achromobacter sp. Root83]|uniref:hypothetical protein n=1 Tax=Achromobacter sp. Root83 TaxID=1736602 RepID=UPI00070EF322|nr:hypothetical protein [Achromobacter sp. Root83]KRC68224.1 ATP synthase F0 subunit C [Achromobacter sp. Root83]